jgi:hypothetical protein
MIMSTISGYAFDSLVKTGGKHPSLLTKIRLVAEAMREGHTAARRYRELTARGVAHDKAAGQVFAELYRAG